MIRPHPKAAPRTNSRRGRKRAQTKILTNTPEKLALEAECKAKEQKELEKQRKAKLRQLRMRSRKSLRELKGASSSSENEELRINDELSVDTDYKPEADIDDFDLASNDWVIVNFVSKKNKLHRYVGQIIKKNRNDFKVKFARKRDDKTFK